jgi:hypothetical protein
MGNVERFEKKFHLEDAATFQNKTPHVPKVEA